MAVPSHARDQADALAAALTKAVGENVPTHADRIRRALAPMIEQHYEDARSRLVDLDTLVAAAHNAVRLSDVAVELTLEPPVSASDLAGSPSIDEDWLVISTVHSAKGLEWEIVHVLSATDGNFPSDMALATAAGPRQGNAVSSRWPDARRCQHLRPASLSPSPQSPTTYTYSQPSRFLSHVVAVPAAGCSTCDHRTARKSPPFRSISPSTRGHSPNVFSNCDGSSATARTTASGPWSTSWRSAR
jgi:DNA helicase-2/ATP-dependent DNA helicase PcrA